MGGEDADGGIRGSDYFGKAWGRWPIVSAYQFYANLSEGFSLGGHPDPLNPNLPPRDGLP